jgi:dUTP pyrophosphatase
MRDFEKISFEQFKKDIKDDMELYNEYSLPKRDSVYTAGYDIYILEDLTIKPGERKKVPTGIKSYFDKEEVLLLVVRSSMGFKYNIRLCNQVGVIDADYYNNKDNEGHIWLMIQNEGDEEYNFKKGEAIVQGLFMKYLTTKSDKSINIQRKSDY